MGRRILVITPYLPVPPNFGGASRMYHLIRELRQVSEVTTVSLTGPGDDSPAAEEALGRVLPIPVALTARMPAGPAKRAAQLRSLVSRRSFQDRLYRRLAMQRAIDQTLVEEPFDLVQLEFSQMGLYRVPAGTPSLLDVHNIEHDVLRQAAGAGSLPRRIFNQIECRKFQREEIAAWRQASACVATSDSDARTIELATGQPVAVIPNGVDLERFPWAPLVGADPASCVFVGAMRYLPNADAARYFVEEIFPLVRSRLPSATITLVGADPPPEVQALAARDGVRVTGTVPDVAPWVHQAGTVIVPLRSGGGTRLKILEAFAMGRPVVSTTIGAAGLDVVGSEHLLLADAPTDFAAAIARLVGDAALRRRLAEQAHALVRDRYQWSAIARRLEAVYIKLAVVSAARTARLD